MVYLTDAPLIPTFQGTLGKLFVLPCAIAVGIGVVCNIFIFPTPASSEAVDGMVQLLSQMPLFLDACLLSFKHPNLPMSSEKLVSAKLQIVTTHKALEGPLNFLPLDIIVRGRWSSDDLASLSELLRRVTVSFIGLLEIHRAKEAHREKDAEALKMAESTYDEESDSKPTRKPGQYQLGQALDFRVKSRHPSGNDLMEKSLRALYTSSNELIEASKEGIAAVLEALTELNSRKASDSRGEMIQRHEDALKKLREHREAFTNLTTQHLLAPHSHLFDDSGLLKMEGGALPPLAGLMLGLLFEERLLQLAGALDKLLSRIVELESTRTKVRIWWSNRLVGLVRWIFRTDDAGTLVPEADADSSKSTITKVDSTQISPEGQPDGKTVHKSAHAQLLSMNSPNSRQRSPSSRILLKITHWFSSTEGIYALRVLIIAISLSLPAVVRSSAGFFYREKGLWAVLMALMTMVPYTADLVYGVLVRTIGTIMGGVIGLVAWYIGAGNGAGNPYGMAAIMAVMITGYMWCRLFSPPAMTPAVIMMAATTYLVVAYSWIDTHIPSYGNPGVGYSVFWRRLVLVIIGFAAAVIVNFLPRPPSANRHYRNLLAASLASVRNRYALFASNWADPAPDLREISEREGLANGEVLLSVMGPVKLTKLEFSTSNFDAAALSQICQLCITLNQSITQLLLYIDRLPAEEKKSIIPSIGATDPDMIAELMAVLTLLQQALKSGDPLPAVLPTPLFARSIRYARRGIHEAASVADGLFARDNLGDQQLRNYVGVFNAWVQLLGALDELVLVMKRAIGETSDVVWQNV